MLSVFFAVGVSDAVAYFHHVVADVLQPVAAEGAPDGYIRYLKPRLLILGLCLALYGIVALLNNSLQFYNNTVSMVLNGVALAVIIWYAVCSSKAVKRYW